MISIKPKQKPFYAMFSLGRILLTAPYSIQACQSFHFLFSTARLFLDVQQERLADSLYMIRSYTAVFSCIRPRSYR